MISKIQKLENLGLNLFASTLVKNLPIDILTHLKEAGIQFSLNDSLCVVAHGGTELWNHIPRPLNSELDSIDNFVIKLIEEFDSTSTILFPHETINLPLQKIGRFLNMARPSFLGIDINKEFGAWFAYRAVFLTKNSIPCSPREEFDSPCESCLLRPCISACVGNAIVEKGDFKIKNCIEYRIEDKSLCQSDCSARRACPYKSEHQYSTEQINYHMLNSFNKIKI